jgi:anti-anti-sigma factor
MGFFCGSIDAGGDPTVVWAVGDVDLAVAARLGAEIEPHLRPDATVLLDCSGITFIDSLGLRVLVHASRVANQVQARFMLAAVPEPVERVLRLAGLASSFTVFGTMAEAKASLAETRHP